MSLLARPTLGFGAIAILMAEQWNATNDFPRIGQGLPAYRISMVN
jgi:hypothetical protein